MRISSHFDSGNIEVHDLSNAQHPLLKMRKDLNSAHFQWFHFKAEDLTPGQRYDFSITNAGEAAYSWAWPGYNAAASYDQKTWFRVPSTYVDGTLSFGLDVEQPQIWFAYFEPYSRERHDWLIDQALVKADAQLVACGKSIEGRDIQLLRISRTPNAQRKIWIIAQQHPGEHMAEWFMEGLIERLKNRDDAELNTLLSKADLYLVPNMNPDGAYRGHLRTNAAGKDLNRAWQSANETQTPEVFFVQQHMRAVGVDLFLDIHGDEEIPHVFTAACEGNPGYTQRIAGLEERFRQRLVAHGAEFQTRYGYPRSEPGKANMALACNAVGQEFDCLSFTIEMPFKDHNDTPNPTTGWDGKRSKQLAKDVLSVTASMVDELR